MKINKVKGVHLLVLFVGLVCVVSAESMVISPTPAQKQDLVTATGPDHKGKSPKVCRGLNASADCAPDLP
jgi:hypothetical protein